MARVIDKLNDALLRAAKPTDKQRKMADGGGLYLLIHPNGGKYWRMDYRMGNKRGTLAIGVYPDVGLKEAPWNILCCERLLSAKSGQSSYLVRHTI